MPAQTRTGSVVRLIVPPSFRQIAEKVAERAFRERGNHSEIHLKRADLVGWCEIAARLVYETSSASKGSAE